MNGRILLSVLGLVIVTIAIVIIFEYPALASYAFYLLILWMVTNFVLLYALRPRGPGVPANSSTDASPFPSQVPSAGSALPSGGPTPSSNSIGFCIYCAAPIAPGTRACPSCGHALPQW